MRPVITTATLLSRKRLTPEIMQLALSVEQEFDFFPGQYISLRQKGERRFHAFSFASSPGSVELIVKQFGAFTEVLLSCPLGTVFDAMAPMGKFLQEAKNPVFVAAGVGITPFLSYVRWMRDKKITDREVWLFYSCKKREWIIAEKELREMQESLSNVNVVLTLTQDNPPDWDMEIGRIDHTMLVKYLGSLEKDFYTCGPDEMVKGLHEQLRMAGVKNERLFEEGWG